MKANKRKKNQKRNMWIGFGAVAVLAVIGWASLRGTDQPVTQAGLQLIATLSPSRFTSDPKARAAYQTAKDIPEVLAQLPCFCGCMTNFGHKNNLFCFSDEHGSACEICENIALDARDMNSRGFSIDKIKQAIIERYSRYAP